MRKKRSLLIALSVALAAFLVWHFYVPKNVRVLPRQPSPTIKSSIDLVKQTNYSTALPIQNPPSLVPEAVTNARMQNGIGRKLTAMERMQNEWRTPIEFYGKVVDENENPVTNADVHFIWTDLSPTGNSERTAKSDGNGLFFLLNTTGKNLIIDVSKAGYYPYQPFASFNYAGENQNFVPDQNNPIVFRLKKRGKGEELIHFDKGFPVPKNGAPILIDLLTGNLITSGENTLKVECWTYDKEKREGWKFDWKCRISVPGGGLQIYNQEFPFLAPEDGYSPNDEIDMTVKPGWSQDLKRNYFIHTADGKFGRITFTMITHGDHFCRIDSFLNPDDSRNLEPK
jgi:hypothetical protein